MKTTKDQKKDELLKEVDRRKAAECELAEKVKELSRSNAELEQFAHVASHDLKKTHQAPPFFLQ